MTPEVLLSSTSICVYTTQAAVQPVAQVSTTGSIVNRVYVSQNDE